MTMAARLHRARMDMLAYAVHFETCSKGRVLAAPTRRWEAPWRDPRCSCGLDRALDDAFAACAEAAT